MIKYIGKVSRENVDELYGTARAGIVIYQPAGNHYESQPIKLFEFMAAGLPVVASNFPLWRELIEGNDCGICVDPEDVVAVRAALSELLDNPTRCKQMGFNGRKAVEARLNWDNESKKLIDLYDTIEAM